jgi:adenosine deaminase
MVKDAFKKEEIDINDPLYQEIFRLPKTDLHCHLDGSLRIDTIIDLIKQGGMPYPINREELAKLVVKDNMIYSRDKSLPEYLKAFEITTSVMQNVEAIERIAFEVAEDAANENVRYLEIRFAPILHTNQGLDMESITGAVCRGLARAEKQYDIVTGIIICAMRHYVPCGIENNLMKSLPYGDPESASVLMALQTARHTVEMAKKDSHIVGFDLAGAEFDNPPKRYKDAFSIVTNGYIPITVHAGEAFGPESIQQAVCYLSVKRIGHGTNLYKDPLLMTYFMNERIPIEVCLTSNLQTNPEHNSYDTHPLKTYLQNRLRTTLCTDNRLVSNTTVTKELYIAAKTFSLDISQIKILITHGFNSALYNCYFPQSPNAYNALRRLRSRVSQEIKYKEALDSVNKAYKEML